MRPPERPLNEAQKAEVRQFEADMLAMRVEIGVTLEDALKTPMAEASVAPLFFAEGLMNGDVQIEGVDLPQFSSPEEAYRYIMESNLDKNQLRELSKKSTEVYKQKAAVALVEGRPIEDTTIEARPIVPDPADFIKKMTDLESARKILLDWKKAAPRGSDVDDAKIAYVAIFLAKIDSQLATGIPMVGTLHEQALTIGDYSTEQAVERLVSPVILRAMEGDDSKKRLFRRLDFLRNGIGYTDEGKATGVSAEVETGTAEPARGGMFSLEQLRYMKETMVEPEDMRRLFESILAKAGMLSSEDYTTWTPGRTHRASDGLFQVVINPSKATFAVDSTSGTYIAASEPRSLYDVMIVGGFHELQHINQALADDAVGKTTKIAGIKGKRISGLREAGANMCERWATKELYGYEKPYADTYASALRALESGGSMGDAIKAFYDAKLRAMPDTNKMAAAKEATDRVLRLVRGGH